MKTIWKFLIGSTGPCDIDVPTGCELVHVDRDPATGLMAFWAEVEPDVGKSPRRFKIVGTGHPIPKGAAHRGTMIQGDYVWHLYELDRPADGAWVECEAWFE